MGLYDTVGLLCPKCGARYNAQSKSGPCNLDYYESPADATTDVLVDINRHAPFHCECGAIFEFDFRKMKTVECGDREPKDYLGVRDIVRD
jgi:hypothetical protein